MQHWSDVEHGSDTFHSVHVEAAARIASVARRVGAKRLVHLSGIGADAGSSSPYIRSRGEGEAAVLASFPGAVIIRPAVMFASDEGFLTTILGLLRSLPALPIFGDGRTRLQPTYADDVAAAITQVLLQSKKPSPIYELAGPRVYSYEELLRTIARTAGLRPVLMRMPFALWDALAHVAEILPHPHSPAVRSSYCRSTPQPRTTCLGFTCSAFPHDRSKKNSNRCSSKANEET